MKVKVHVQGVKGSVGIQSGEDADVLLHGVLEIDGVLIEEVGRIELVMGGGAMAEVKAVMQPGSFEIVTHTTESWPELLRQINDAKRDRDGTGRLSVVEPTG